MWKKITIGLLIAAVIGVAVYWFTYTKELHTPVSDAIKAIPINAAFVIESKQTKNCWQKLSQSSVIWQEMLNTELFSSINSQAHTIDSLIASDVSVLKLLENRSFFISAHVSGASSFDYLYVYSLPNLTYQSTIEAFFKKINNGVEPITKKYAGVDIATVYPGNALNDSISFALSNGILMMSKKQTLVEFSLRQLKSDVSLATDKNFSKIINTTGKNVDANIYINYKNFPTVLNRFLSPLIRRDVLSLSDFADCSGWDVAIKPNSFLFSGFTQANDSAANFLNLFRNQKPQEMELTKVLPSKTALLFFVGVSNIKVFQHDYKNYLSATQQLRVQSYEQYIESINKKYAVNIEKVMLEWIDNEMALVITEPASDDFTNNAYAVFHSNNIEEAITGLDNLVGLIKQKDAEEAHPSKEKGKKSVVPENENWVEKYRNHSIGYINIPQLLPQLLGWQFKKVSTSYFTAIDDYMVFGNSINSLKSYIDDVENKKTLDNDKNYKAFSENISTETNLYLYTSIARSASIYSSFVAEELVKDMEDKQELMYKFEALGLQFTINPNNKLFYSNAYLKYNPNYKQESGTIWESKLDTTVSSKPQVVINHNTKAKEIFVQDDANKIYLIGNNGKVLWTKQLSEKIMGDVLQIDALKNEKLQLVFNTKKAVYILDRNGNEMRGFPIKLVSSASNVITVCDYESNRDYRIFVACEDKTIHCFKTNGEAVSAFKFGKTAHQVKVPIKYVKIDNKDHLIVVDVKGKAYILDRHGEERTKIKEQLPGGLSDFYVEAGKDYAKSLLVACDSLGNVIKLTLNGEKETKKFKRFSVKPFFEYRDINNDKINECIFVSDNELSVFSQGESPLFSYEFKNSIGQTPLFFSFVDGETKIGVLSEQTDEIYLFNSNGTLYKGFPVTGKTLFSIGDLNNDGTHNLITGSAQGSIFVYQLNSKAQ